MLNHYARVTWRALRRHRVYTFINVTGLAVGMGCALLIFLYVRDELSYDRFHEQADRIYRVAHASLSGDGVRHARTPHPLAPTLASEFPEVEAAVRLRRTDAVVRRADQLFKEEAFYFTDAAVFDVFSFPLLAGNPEAALREPFSVVLTETTARKYFGAGDPVGQALTLTGLGDLTVTGVVEDAPANTHFTFDFLASYATLNATQPDQLQAWDAFVTSTYVLLAEGSAPTTLEAGMPRLVDTHLRGDDAAMRFYLDPLTAIHLKAHVSGDLGEGSDAGSLHLFASIALFILLIAAINFMNLATARFTERAREVGMRKVLGAARHQLIRQFLGESVLLSMLALALTLVLVEATVPTFNALAGKTLTLDAGPLGWLLLLGAGLGIGLLAGSYPAFALSAFAPLQSLNGGSTPGSAGAWLRKTLVVVQFGLAILLITGTLVTAEQLAYLQNKDLGFNKEQVVVMRLQDASARSRVEALKDALRAEPTVAGVAASYHTPGGGLGVYYTEVEGVDDPLDLPTYIVDYDFIETMGMEVVAGRAFAEAFATDASAAFMVNEAAVRHFGWDEPLGKTVLWDGEKRGSVIGVVKDFHYQSLHQAIEPLVIHVDPAYLQWLSVRIRPDNVPATLAALQATYRQFDPDHPFEYSFVDEDFAAHYRAEQRMALLMRSAALLAILIACLGLLGLASIMTQRRTKEIGVRKVLGASVPGLVLLLSGDFARLVAVAFAVGAPVAYLILQPWLDAFAYRIALSWQTFLAAGLIALVTAVLTVSYQAVRAALADPVKALRYE